MSRFVGPQRGAATTRIAVVVDGTLIAGVPSAPSRWDEHVNEVLDRRAADTEDEELREGVRGLKSEPSDEDDGRFITLRDAAIVVGGIVGSLEVDAIRIDSDRVGAWLVGDVRSSFGAEDEGDGSEAADERSGD